MSKTLVNTHNETIKFGKHKGERWTRLPLGYLKWILNEMEPAAQAYIMAEAELERRGDTMPAEIEISNHAIDKASLRVRKAWHTDRQQDEGLYSWLVRISTEALSEKNDNGTSQNERINWKGCKLVFTYGNFYPTLKTVMNDKSYKLPEQEICKIKASQTRGGATQMSNTPISDTQEKLEQSEESE